MSNDNMDSEQSAAAAKAPEETKYLTFWTEGELFGIPISDVVQIISMQQITPLPDFPAYAKGVINLRGNIIPVIDMRLRLHKPEAKYNESTCIIVTNIHDVFIGFIVDTVDEVADIDSDHISPAPKMSHGNVNRYLTGIGQRDEKVILLLDFSKILSEDEFAEVAQTAAEASSSPETASASPEQQTV